ncbi:hypothetical protein HanRHA438_Chr03g0148341 [Helianthus annuus]|nr:hypothetical protein HanRHA438_Chr03g0148341 [Helianthus annuus]
MTSWSLRMLGWFNRRMAATSRTSLGSIVGSEIEGLSMTLTATDELSERERPW